jgi:hypothetical protein
VARYREKDEGDLVWNETRRVLTRELDTKITNWRERSLNKLLTAAWGKHQEALKNDTLKAVESDYADWVTKALGAAVGDEFPELDGEEGEVLGESSLG